MIAPPRAACLARHWGLSCLVLLASAVMLTPPATADDDKRPIPDYDGRPPPSVTAGEVLLWIPRVILSPVYFVNEFVLRRPLGFTISAAEKADLPGVLADFFVFDAERKAGLLPTFLVDFGLEPGVLPSGGIYFFWNDAGFDGHDIRLRAAFGGHGWVQVRYADRYRLPDGSQLSLNLRYEKRSDAFFAGFGPTPDPEDPPRFGLAEQGISLRYERDIGRRGSVEAELAGSYTDFFAATCCDDPSLFEGIDQGRIVAPPGSGGGFAELTQSVVLALDTRDRRPEPESGVRAELRGHLSFDLTRADGSGWGGYGATLAGYVDVYRQRVFGLALSVDFVDPFGGATLPFVRYAELGGDRMMDLQEGVLRGRSAVTATFDYRWPIWTWLDARLFTTVGNVFDAHLSSLSGDDLRLAFGLSLRTGNTEDHPFQITFAGGTETFGNGAEVTSFRLLVGTTSEF